MIFGHSTSIHVSLKSYRENQPLISLPVKSAPLWELVKPVPGNEPPPKRTGHIMLSMDDTLYMCVFPAPAHCILLIPLTVLEERMDPITITTHGHSTQILVHGKSLLALV